MSYMVRKPYVVMFVQSMSCYEAVCTKRGKNNKQLGYNSFCQHVATEHGGLREIMQKDSRPKIKYILEKIR